MTDVNTEVIFFNRILAIIAVITLAIVIFDIIPLREVVYFFVKKVDKEKVAINIGTGLIIELGKNRAKFIHIMNYGLSILQIASAITLFWITSLVVNNNLIINEMIINSITIPQKTINYLFSAVMIILGIGLFLGGILLWITNRESKTIGI